MPNHFEFEVTYLNGEFEVIGLFAENYPIAWGTVINKLYRDSKLPLVAIIGVIR